MTANIALVTSDAGKLPLMDGVAHVCVTSPPYWRQRVYDTGGNNEIGTEATPEAYIDNLVSVFREIRRVLRPEGVCWVNVGDCYWGGDKGGQSKISKPLDLMNIPARLVLALQSDGWYHRSTIIWYKLNPKPEPINGWRWERCRVKVRERGKNAGDKYERLLKPNGDIGSGNPHAGRDHYEAQWEACPGCPKCKPNGGLVFRRYNWRPTTAHEYIFMLSKSSSYFSDAEAAKERAVEGHLGDNFPDFRNMRSVWVIPTSNYKGAHTATFPKELPLRCLQASTSDAGCCPECGVPWARIVQRNRKANKTLGFRKTCKCSSHQGNPMLVIDPFAGTGTTGLAARELGHDFIGFDLSFDYLNRQARRRLRLNQRPLFRAQL